MIKSRRINRTMKIRAGKLSSGNSGQWHFISDLPEFSSNFISEFSKYYVPKGRSFNQIRKFVRMKYSSEVLVVSQSGRVKTCMCTELSAGGAKVKVPADFLEEGQTMTVQFFYNGNIKLKSFKAKATVLRLSEINFEGAGGDVSEVYSLEFSGLKASYKRMLLNSTQIKIESLAKYIRGKQKEVVDILDLNEFSERYPHLMLSP